MPNRNLAAKRLLAVTEEELQRIVLDVHDGPVQNLFAALSQLSLLKSRLGNQPGAEDCLVFANRAASLLESSLAEIRDLLGRFRAPEFIGRDMGEIIEDIAIQYESLTSGTVKLEIEDRLPHNVPLPVKIALCRILQEALSNIRRHAGVEDAAVEFRRKDQNLVLVVADKGRGFEPPPLDGPQATEKQEHIGLRGMRERAELVGGRLTVESHPEMGTRIQVELPLHE